MVSVITPCVYCAKVSLSKTKHHMATLYNCHTWGFAVHCSDRTNSRQANTLQTLFSSHPADFGSSSLLLIFGCFVQLRGQGLQSSECICLYVCLLFLVAWQLLLGLNNAPLANKCTQLTLRSKITDILCRQYSYFPCTFTLSPVSLSSFPELGGAHLGWHGEDRPSDMPAVDGKRNDVTTLPVGTLNCLSCLISGIWLLYFTYSESNLTSTGWDNLLLLGESWGLCDKGLGKCKETDKRIKKCML